LYKNDRPAYKFSIPSASKRGLGRAKHSFAMLVPTEEIKSEFDATPDFGEQLQAAITEHRLPLAYDNHIVVRNSATPVSPFSLFMDGVPYSNTDSVIGVWLVNLITRRRHLIGSLRSHLLCVCGCKGWCTFFSVFQFLSVQFALMAAGKHMSARHDEKPWNLPMDRMRAALAASGELLQFVCCILWIQGDWAEYAKSLGLPTWQDLVRPCFGCNGWGEMLQRIGGASPMTLPARSIDDDDYFEACAMCEFSVELSQHQRDLIAERLLYDKRPDGSRGRALNANVDVTAPKLLQGDRLEPSPTLLDVSDFEAIVTFPVRATFWRPSHETMTRHRNPIFQRELGITPRILTVDLLHAFYLGVLQRWCRVAVWMVINSGVFGRVGTQDERIQIAIIALGNMLNHWYKRRHSANPLEKLTRITTFKRGRVGDPGDPQCKTKGAETWGFMLFLLDVMHTHLARLPDNARRVMDAGLALKGLMDLFDAAGPRLTSVEIQQAWDFYSRFGALTDDDEDFAMPKRHVALHLLERLPDLGNPKVYANWLNEAYNKHMKLACRTTNQFTFETSLYTRMREIMRRCHEDLIS
jgi:hypothetical protein